MYFKHGLKNLEKIACVVVVLTLTTMGAAFAAASADFTRGVAYFNRSDFAHALVSFAQAVKANPGDSTAAYYYALCLQNTGRSPEAMTAYQTIVRKFPRSKEAGLSKLAISELLPSEEYEGGAWGEGHQNDHRVVRHGQGLNIAPDMWVAIQRPPEQTMINFEPAKDGRMVVSASWNGKPLYMDVNLSGQTSIPRNLLTQFGTVIPENSDQSSYAYGDLGAGGLRRHGFKVNVTDKVPRALLGSDFFINYRVTINKANNYLVLRRKAPGELIPEPKAVIASGAPSVANSATEAGIKPTLSEDQYFSIVYTVDENGQILLPVYVNGVRTLMIYNQGPEMSEFDKDQIRYVASDQMLPESPGTTAADTDTNSGIYTTDYVIKVRSMKLEKIVKYELPVHVHYMQASRWAPFLEPRHNPILGRNFYAGWTVTIDPKNRVVHFTKD
jgi:tetratricopeptide (TPR) repeat protein